MRPIWTKTWVLLQKTSEFNQIHVNMNCPFKRPLSPRSQRVYACAYHSCEVVSRLHFGALGGLGGRAGVKHGVVGV